jgi:hypothetical protein
MAGPRCRHCGGTDFIADGEPDEIGRCRECAEFLTMGFEGISWTETFCVVPDRDFRGAPFIPTTEQARFYLQHYRLLPSGRWFHPRGSQIIRPQGWGKGPLAAAWVCLEAAGPVVFDGWNAKGEPVGRPWATPHLQITACSEDQTDNTWRALQPMIELGPLGEDFIPDTGLTRINLPGGGLIEPVTASHRSRLGQRITGAVQDQSESWVRSNHGWALADNQRRGLAKMGGRFLETGNAPDPVEDSVAYRTPREPGVYIDDVDGGPGSVRNKVERRKVLRKVYGDSLVERGGWVPLERIEIECEAKLVEDPGQAERWFMNRKIASEGAAFDIEQFKLLAKPRTVPKDSVIVLGVDGARYEDALAVVATDVRTGYQWPVVIVEKPEYAPDDYEHDFKLVDAAVKELGERHTVWRIYIDPQRIDWLVESWGNHFGRRQVVHRETYVQRRMAFAIRAYEQAIAGGDVSHDGDPTFVAHVRNARKRMVTVLDEHERPMHLLAKDHVRSPRKIDAAMAAILSWEARGHALEKGVVSLDESKPQERPRPPKPYEADFAPNVPALIGGWTGGDME